MYKVERPFMLDCFKNARTEIWKDYNLESLERLSYNEQIKISYNLWKSAYNVLFISGVTRDGDPIEKYAVFDSEEDFIFFKLRWC